MGSINRDQFQNVNVDYHEHLISSEFHSPLVPIAITLRNVYVPQKHCTKFQSHMDDEHQSFNDDNFSFDQEEEEYMKKMRRWTNCHHLPLHKSVFTLKMEIIVPYSRMKKIKQSYKDILDKPKFTKMFGLKNIAALRRKHSQKKDNNEEEDNFIVLCSKIIQHPSSHLLWNHFKENLDDLYASIPVMLNSGSEVDHSNRTLLWKDIQSCMKIRCRAFCIPTSHSPYTSTSRVDNLDDYDTYSEQPLRTITLASLDLDPDSLAALPPSNNTNIIDTTVISQSKFSRHIPNSLPSNTFLIHFSDGSTRVSLNLYDTLIKKQIIHVEATTPVHIGKRFDDKDFDVLDDQRDYAKVKLKMDELSVHACTDGMTGSAHKKDHQNINGMNHKNGTRGAFTDVFESVSSSSKTSRHSSGHGYYVNSILFMEEDGESHSSSDICDEIVIQPLDVIQLANTESHEVHCESDKDWVQRLDRDIVTLKYELQLEDERLKAALTQQRKLTAQLGDLTNKIDDTERALTSIHKNSQISLKHVSRLDFFLKMKKKKLLQDLSKIYPIQMLPDSVYTIRGIHLPSDMHSLVASEEVISAGLGFVCHVVAMCSKYLEVPLRYRLICNSSRSAIRDDNFDVYPLFKERVVEKDQFDRAIVLLHRNIERLLDAKNVSINTRSEQTHILSKLQLIFD